MGRLEDSLGNAQVVTLLEGAAERLQRKLAADSLRVGEDRRTHRRQIVARPWLWPAHARQTVGERPPLHLRHPARATLGIA